MNYVIGIDGGGTKTKAILADEKANILAQLTEDASNYHVVGKKQTAKVLSTIFHRFNLSYGISVEKCRSICIGMAGLGRTDDKAVIQSLCSEMGISQNLILTHDAKIALIGGTIKNHGVILNSGTGSIAYGISPSGKEARAGGWGHLLGDEGSGYYIAIRGLKAVIRTHDGRAEKTLLTELILDRLNFDSPDSLVRWIHSVDKRDIASLASPVFRAASKGDSVAKEIIKKAADELTLTAKTVIEKLSLTQNEFEIVLSGGIFENQPDFVSTIQKRLKFIAKNAKIHLPIHEPAFGAIILAIEGLKGQKVKRQGGKKAKR